MWNMTKIYSTESYLFAKKDEITDSWLKYLMNKNNAKGNDD